MLMLSLPRRMLVLCGMVFVLFGALAAPSVSNAVTVGPAKLQISADPGESVSGSLYVKNDSAAPATFYPSVQRFSQAANGQKVFADDPSGMAAWLRLPQSVTLASQEDRQVPFVMEIPADAEPGGHFAVIWWSTSPPGDGGQVAIVTRAGILVYARVSGDIVESGHITSLSAESRFTWGLPVNFSINFINEGNVALTPAGEVRVANIFGSLKAVLPVNPYGAIILPGSTESFTVPWNEKGFFFGVYKATAHLTYGEDGQVSQTSWWFVMVSPLAGLLLVLLVMVAFVLPPLIRKYNLWIIRRAQQF